MQRLILLILVLSLFSRITWCCRKKRDLADRLYGRYGISFNCGSVRLRGISGLEVVDSDIRISRHCLHATIERFFLSIELASVLRGWSFKHAFRFRVKNSSVAYEKMCCESSEAGKLDSNRNNINSISVWYQFYEIFSRFFFEYVKEIGLDGICLNINGRELWSTEDVINVVVGDAGCFFSASLVEARNNSRYKLSFFETTNADVQARRLCVSITLDNVYVNQRVICPESFMLKQVEFEIITLFGPSLFVITDESCATIDQIPFSFYFSYEESEKDVFRFTLYTDIEAKLFLKTFPAFYMDSLRDIEVEGNLFIRCRWLCSVNNIFEHILDIDIMENTLSIKDWGAFDLSYINGPFTHVPVKDGKRMVQVRLDDIKANQFLNLEYIPEQLIAIILFAEDPGFYKHIGVDPFFIGYAIAVNISSRRVIRGASTITMQLVKNLFLENDRSLIRKIEEIVISLLLENYFHISKKRILEIYLNIIEFGPGVYGVNDAALFYFGKKIDELTITECISLTYIIPRPIHFYDALILKSSQLARNLSNHIQRMRMLLLKKNVITEDAATEDMLQVSFAGTFGSICLRSQSFSFVGMGERLSEKSLFKADLSPLGFVNKRSHRNWAYPLNEHGRPEYILAEMPDSFSRIVAIHEVVRWLNVEKSIRYTPFESKTFCNIYVYDILYCLNIYIPRVWWNEDSICRLRRGHLVENIYGETVSELNCNMLSEWFENYGREFGWEPLSDLSEMQNVVNKGTVGVIVAKSRDAGSSGHIVTVLPEIDMYIAKRAGEVVVSPLQSQAGAVNKIYFTADNWWIDKEKFDRVGFWICMSVFKNKE